VELFGFNHCQRQQSGYGGGLRIGHRDHNREFWNAAINSHTQGKRSGSKFILNRYFTGDADHAG